MMTVSPRRIKQMHFKYSLGKKKRKKRNPSSEIAFDMNLKWLVKYKIKSLKGWDLYFGFLQSWVRKLWTFFVVHLNQLQKWSSIFLKNKNVIEIFNLFLIFKVEGRCLFKKQLKLYFQRTCQCRLGKIRSLCNYRVLFAQKISKEFNCPEWIAIRKTARCCYHASLSDKLRSD